VLWSGTPILTWPQYKYKMASRVGASMAHATGFGDKMVVHSLADYEARAVALADTPDELAELRRALFLNRDHMPLFDTARWTRNLEKGFREAWRRWALGTEFEASREWEECDGPEKESGCIFVEDTEPVTMRAHADWGTHAVGRSELETA
jgi:protein O-GlcNAc transferase